MRTSSLFMSAWALCAGHAAASAIDSNGLIGTSLHGNLGGMMISKRDDVVDIIIDGNYPCETDSDCRSPGGNHCRAPFLNNDPVHDSIARNWFGSCDPGPKTCQCIPPSDPAGAIAACRDYYSDIGHPDVRVLGGCFCDGDPYEGLCCDAKCQDTNPYCLGKVHGNGDGSNGDLAYIPKPQCPNTVVPQDGKAGNTNGNGGSKPPST